MCVSVLSFLSSVIPVHPVFSFYSGFLHFSINLHVNLDFVALMCFITFLLLLSMYVMEV